MEGVQASWRRCGSLLPDSRAVRWFGQAGADLEVLGQHSATFRHAGGRVGSRHQQLVVGCGVRVWTPQGVVGSLRGEEGLGVLRLCGAGGTGRGRATCRGSPGVVWARGPPSVQDIQGL